MSFKEWKAYWKKSDWTRKWFVVFMLLRPIVDNFYKVKEYSSFLSPIYILGVLTPLLAIYSIVTNKRKRISSPVDEFIRIWGVFIFLNCTVILITFYSLNTLGDCIKYITPPLIFFYLRTTIQNKEDLRFILQTFLFSCIFPFAMMFFEIFVHPITPEYASQGRGGGERIRGEYADSMNYATFLVGSFLVYGYFFLDDIYNRRRKKQTTVFKMVLWFVACIIGAISLRHVATWVVFLTLIITLLYYNAQNLKGMVFVIFVAAIILPFFARTIYEKQIYPLVAKEYNVIDGDQDIQYAFNGRMSRWEKYFDIWDDMPIIAHVIGVSFSGSLAAPVMIGGGMHNDYIRNLFLTGIVGVVFYVIFFLLLLFWRAKNLRVPERFLLIGSVAAIMLYSVSTLPTIYPGLYCLVYPVYCFAILPVKQSYGIKSKPRPSVFLPEINPAL